MRREAPISETMYPMEVDVARRRQPSRVAARVLVLLAAVVLLGGCAGFTSVESAFEGPPPARPVDAVDIEGNVVRIADLRSQDTLVWFWTPW